MSEAAANRHLRMVINQSFFAELPPDLLATLLDGSHVIHLPAGAVIYEETDRPAWMLLVKGLIRTYVTASDGRQLTVRYFRPGDVLGYSTVFGGSLDVTARTMSSVETLVLDPRDLRVLVRHEGVAWALLRELAGRMNDLVRELEANAFGTVKQRLARHLLDLAVPRGSSLVVELSHQELADAIGSVREVVQRELRELSRAGMVRTMSSFVAILDAERLYATAKPAASRD